MTICIILLDIAGILKTTPDTDKICHLLVDNDFMWYEIGLSLRVHHSVLNNLKCSPGCAYYKLKKVIKNQKESEPSPITWKTVISAIESPIVNNKEIANDIRYNFKYGK